MLSILKGHHYHVQYGKTLPKRGGQRISDFFFFKLPRAKLDCFSILMQPPSVLICTRCECLAKHLSESCAISLSKGDFPVPDLFSILSHPSLDLPFLYHSLGTTEVIFIFQGISKWEGVRSIYSVIPMTHCCSLQTDFL